MRGGEIGHTRSTVLDAPVTQRAMHVIGRGWSAAHIAGRDSDARRAPGGIWTLAPLSGGIRTLGGRRASRSRPKRPQCPNLARERGRRPNFARQGKRCPKLAREREHYPEALTQTRSQARAWQNIPVRAILFHSPYEAPRYAGARRAAIAHAVMRSDSAEGGPWHTTPYKKIACA